MTKVGEIEWSEPCYSFDTTCVWKDAEGTLYWASDSGCSCPSPFEDFTDLSQLTKGTFWDLEKELKGHSYWSDSDREYAEPQVVELIMKLRVG